MASKRPDDEGNWRLVLVALFALAALGLAVASHFVPGLRLCETAVQTSRPTSETERTEESGRSEESGSKHVGRSTETATKTKKLTQTPAYVQTTKACRGASVAQFAVLLVPAIVVLIPKIKSFDLAGVLKVDLRELKGAVEETKKDVGHVQDALRVMQVQLVQQTQSVQQQVVINNVAGQVERGASEARQEAVVPVEELPEE